MRPVFLGVVAVFVAAAIGAAVVIRRGDEPAVSVPSGIGATTTIGPSRALFGDPLDARLVVYVDPAEVDPGTVRVRAEFAPYRALGTPAIVRSSADGVVSLRYRFTLTCLRQRCLPPMRGPREFRFPRAVVTARRTAGKLAVVSSGWDRVRVSGRVSAAEVSQPTWDSHENRVPPVTYRAAPRRLAWTLDVLAALLAAAGAALLAWRALPAVRRALTRDELAGLESIDRALALLRRALRQGEATEQRKALDRLARELRSDGDDELAVGARHLAWSQPDPVPDAVDELTGRVATRENGA
jgi:hypothetical protein